VIGGGSWLKRLGLGTVWEGVEKVLTFIGRKDLNTTGRRRVLYLIKKRVIE